MWLQQLQVQRQMSGCVHSSEQFLVQEPKPMNSEHPRVPAGNPLAMVQPPTLPEPTIL